MRQFKLHFKYTEEEVKYWFIPRKDVIYSYVVERIDENKNPIVTDLISFYSLPSTIINNAKHSHLRVEVMFIRLGCIFVLQCKHENPYILVDI